VGISIPTIVYAVEERTLFAAIVPQNDVGNISISYQFRHNFSNLLEKTAPKPTPGRSGAQREKY
jgi:hypothetical protein